MTTSVLHIGIAAALSDSLDTLKEGIYPGSGSGMSSQLPSLKKSFFSMYCDCAQKGMYCHCAQKGMPRTTSEV